LHGRPQFFADGADLRTGDGKARCRFFASFRMTASTTATADPYGMTNKGTSRDKSKSSGESGSNGIRMRFIGKRF
jgi:hypothetical protein